MALPKLSFPVSLFLLVIFTWGDCTEDAVVMQPKHNTVSPPKPAELELRQHELKISLLESSIEYQTAELRRKDAGIMQQEKLIEEKSDLLASLHVALQSDQMKGSLKVRERIGEVNKRVDELEEQIVKIKKEIEAQNKKKDVLEARAETAEKKIERLNLKLEKLKKINDKQKLRIHRTQHALQMAEEDMLKVKLESSFITKQLKEVHRAWLPPWLSAYLTHCQSFVTIHWNEIGKPAFDWIIQKKCFQAIKEWYNGTVDDFYPWMQSFIIQATDYYHLAENSIKLHILKLVEPMNPYFQEAKMFVIPYVDQVSEITKPHLVKARLWLKPYSKKVVHYHKQITNNVRSYHSQVQANIRRTLRRYELTKPLATERLVWFMTSILIAVPAILIFRMLPLGQPKKRRDGTSRNQNRRRGRRAHRDK